ncbi:hypothetical protein [Winogradskyella sp. PE311]|uniref:hypothetical protein n=1 Tax=Winogradskyella sp. PE311 TaxID=3366943 RepID=UPI00398093B0
MVKLIKHIILFSLILIFVGEIVVRTTHAVSDIPQRTIDEFGIQKYIPNQNGYWVGGDHQWTINKLGWPGILPKSYDNLITVIGDSYIENFMNPNDCHQSVLLKEYLPEFNFLEAARSGVSLIEAMEISKQTDEKDPLITLIYVNDNDFTESIENINNLNDITQINLESGEIDYGKMKSPKFKKILYSWKLLYYFYNRYSSSLTKGAKKPKLIKRKKTFKKKYVSDLLDHIISNYSMEKKVLVFHPNTNPELIKLCKELELNIIVLDSNNDKTWTFEYDTHWTCYGHKKVSQQVSTHLLNNYLLNK